MRVRIYDLTFLVSFHHQHFDPPGNIDGKFHTLTVSHCIECVIRNATAARTDGRRAPALAWHDARLVTTGKAWCAVDDHFNIHVGRRVALRKALRDWKRTPDLIARAGDNPIDTAFWQAFITTLPKRKASPKELRRRMRVLQRSLADVNLLLKGIGDSLRIDIDVPPLEPHEPRDPFHDVHHDTGGDR